MKNLCTPVICLIAIIFIDFALTKTSVPVNKNSYLLGFDKFRSHAARTVGQKRIILFGGSSLGWGVSAKELTAKLGILTLNSGIHAGIGYTHFLKTMEDVIDKEKDLLVFSPEYSIVSEDSKFSRSNEYCEITIFVRRLYPLKCIGYSLNKIFKIIPVLDRVNAEYKYDGFNEFGDYTYRIKGQNMIGLLGKDYRCSGWKLSDLHKNYIPYMKELESIGYRIMYVPTFLPKTTCRYSEKIENFHSALIENFGVMALKNAKLLFDEKYFYNSAYHLTNEGITLKTKIFEENLKLFMEIK